MRLRASLTPLLSPPRLSNQRIRVFAEGRQISEWSVNMPGEYEAIIPGGVLDDGELNLELQVPDATAPEALGLGRDFRELGIAVSRIEFLPVAYYVSGTVLKFGANGGGTQYQRGGWAAAENGFSWTEGHQAALEIPVRSAAAMRLTASLTPLVDGRTTPVQHVVVKVAGRDVTVRGRSWVTLPKLAAVASPAPNPSTPTPTPETSALSAAPKPLPESVRGLADAYAQRDAAAIDRLLSTSANLARLIRDFRDADPPWPDVPARSDVLALDLAIAGLSNANGFARDEGLKLLTLTHLVVEGSAQRGAFACKWFWAEAAALEGLSKPETSLPFVERARRRCPAEPRRRSLAP
jgi:hypothetical protein